MFKILIIIFLKLTIIFSQNNGELFYEGNKFYSQNKFEKAIESYEKILDTNYFSEDLYLNLGNAYFQESNFGLARWSYEMGLILNPVNSDLKNNNNINKAYIESYIELPKNNILDIINVFFQSLSLNQFILVNSVIIFLTALSFFLMKVFQVNLFSRLFYSLITILFLSILITFTKNIWDQNNNFAIIVSEESIMYSAPFLNQGIQQSIFYNGNKVKIHQKTDSWIEVSVYDGRKGWIRASDVRNLN